jgi:hypothetical protein
MCLMALIAALIFPVNRILIIPHIIQTNPLNSKSQQEQIKKTTHQ